MGLDAHELSEKTELPIKTVYAQTTELYRQYYVNYLDIPTKTRGRPTTITEEKKSSLRHRTKVVIEDTKGIYNIYDGKKSVPLPPGNVLYSEGFTDAWFTIVSEKEENELFQALLNFLKRALRRIKEADNESIRKWAPIEDMSMGEGKRKTDILLFAMWAEP